MEHLRGDQLAGQDGRGIVALLLGEVAFQDGIGRTLSEIRLEYGRQGQPPAGPPAAYAISPRRHRPAR